VRRLALKTERAKVTTAQFGADWHWLVPDAGTLKPMVDDHVDWRFAAKNFA
jgi:hypothetical protein